MLKLVTLPAAFGMRNVSPFCLKIEMLLTALNLPFTMTELNDPRQAPKGKLPFLHDGEHCIADSELITEYLDQKTSGQVYAGLSPQQIGQGVALSRLAEDHLYWIMVASRWLDDEWWPNIVSDFFGFVPALIRPIPTTLARRQVRQTYNLHGLGRHTLAEQRGFAERDLLALENSVPAEGFLFGEKPCIYDFAIASIVAGIVDNQPATWLTELAQPRKKLLEYTERVQSAVGVHGRFIDS
jgi:glutathione S-transferase